MADPTGEPHVAAFLAKLAPYAPAFAGSVLSLAFLDKLTWRGRVLAVVVGFVTAMFLAPGLASILERFFWSGSMPPPVSRMIEFAVALCAMGTLPPLLGWMRKVAGDPLSLLKVRIGPQGGAE